MKSFRACILFLIAPALLAACSSAPKETAPAETTPKAPASSSAPAGIAVGHGSEGGAAQPMAAQAPAAGAPVSWTAPARWESKPASGMRLATYVIPAAKGDTDGGELAVFTNIGGGVQANIDRWIGQFDQADAGKAKQGKETINGFAVTSVDLTGTFKGGGMAMGQNTGPKSGYRLLGAIVETPAGEVFFKMTGPAKTIAAAQAEFQGLLKSLKK